MPFEMSEYERARLDRIKQNEQVLRDLGLNEKVEMMKKSSTKKRSGVDERSHGKEKEKEKMPPPPRRKSRRVQELPSDECTFKLYYREVNRYYHMEIPR